MSCTGALGRQIAEQVEKKIIQANFAKSYRFRSFKNLVHAIFAVRQITRNPRKLLPREDSTVQNALQYSYSDAPDSSETVAKEVYKISDISVPSLSIQLHEHLPVLYPILTRVKMG